MFGCNSSESADTDSSTAPDVTTKDGSTQDQEKKELVIADNGTTDFKVIRTDDDIIYYKKAAGYVRNKISEILQAEFAIDTDFENPRNPIPADAHEILVGITTREESISTEQDLPESGYIIRVTEHKVVVLATEKNLLSQAINEFFSNVVQNPEYNKDGRLALPIGLEIKNECSYSIKVGEEMLNGKTVEADIELLFHQKRPDSNTNSQGAATDGKYVYTIMKRNESGVETGYVVKIDMNTWEAVLTGPVLPLNHANDMTYDSKGNRLVVTNMAGNLITIINPETLEMIEQKNLGYGTYGVAYNEATNRFVFLAYGGRSGIIETDENFNFTRQIVVACDSAAGFTGQGMDCDENYIYVPLSPGDIKKNKIQVYDWSGAFLGNVMIEENIEIETVMHVGEEFYANFNNSGSKIFKLDFYVVFE